MIHPKELISLLASSLNTPRNITGLIVGFLGSAATFLFGGWTTGMATLATFQIIDYFTGLAVAGIFKKSPKTQHGGLKSDIGAKGLVKKFLVWAIVAMTHLLDVFLGIDYLLNMCIIGFLFNETVSITENVGLVIDLPPVVTKAIELLNQKSNGGPEDV